MSKLLNYENSIFHFCFSAGSYVITLMMISTDDSEDESDIAEPSEDKEDGENTFMHSYSDVMNEELKTTTLEKSFVRANEQAQKKAGVYFPILHEKRLC